jgi:hypothetical protein
MLIQISLELNDRGRCKCEVKKTGRLLKVDKYDPIDGLRLIAPGAPPPSLLEIISERKIENAQSASAEWQNPASVLPQRCTAAI